MKGKKGARCNVLAVQPYGGIGYTTARLSVVSYEGVTPVDGADAMQLWWDHKPLKDCTVRSTLHRRLPTGKTHVEKMMQEIEERWNTNVLLVPKRWPEAQGMQKFLGALVAEFDASPAVEVHGRWLLPAITNVQSGIYRTTPVPTAERVVRTGEQDKDMAWAMMQSWLDAHLPMDGLRVWYQRDEYLQRRQERIDRSNQRRSMSA